MTRQHGIDSEFLRNPSTTAKKRPENICEFSGLRDLRDEIPCMREQGINSTTTGKSIRDNSELIRDNSESTTWGIATKKWLEMTQFSNSKTVISTGFHGLSRRFTRSGGIVEVVRDSRMTSQEGKTT